MTRVLPPSALQASAMPRDHSTGRAVADIFKGAPSWQVDAAMAAVYRLRPQLGVEADPELHALHLWAWPRAEHSDYFYRLCRLLKLYGIGDGA